MSIGDPVLWVELVMLSALLTAGLCAAWTDLRFHRVPNRYTLGLLAIGVAGQAAMVGLGVGGGNHLAGTLLLGLTIAFMLTLTGVWPPADAKMYWAAVAALPPSLCPVGKWVSMETPPAALIVNTLVAYVAVLLPGHSSKGAGTGSPLPYPKSVNRGDFAFRLHGPFTLMSSQAVPTPS